jgi:hypothetical protein
MNDTISTTDRNAEIIDQYERDLLSGAVFARAAGGQRSYIGYRPPTNRRDYADLVKRLATLADRSDQLAQIAHAIIGRLNLYGCREELYASAYDAAYAAVSKGYTDVIGLASPEPPRRRDATRPYSVAALVAVAETLADGRPGWCLEALRRKVFAGLFQR